MRTTIYIGIVTLFLIGGALDYTAGKHKSAAIALALAMANLVIFFWPEDA